MTLPFRSLAVASALAAVPAFARATPSLQSTSVRLPDGSIATMRYAGDIAPTLTIAPPPLNALFRPTAATTIGGAKPCTNETQLLFIDGHLAKVVSQDCRSSARLVVPE